MNTVEKSEPSPDLESFGRFVAALGQSFPTKDYRWTPAKERSCDWMIERVPAGATGLDIGGTEYLCKQLAAKGCQVTYYDLVAPKDFEKYVQDDMFNVLRHFEPKSMDFIVTRHTLEHSIIPLFQLWAYNQLLTDGGQLLVTVPCYHDRWIWMNTHFHVVPPESWHMLFHRAGFVVREYTSGSWKPRHAEFVEHRFVLGVDSRSLRLTGRPKKALRSTQSAMAAADPDRAPRGPSVPGVTPGQTEWASASRWNPSRLLGRG